MARPILISPMSVGLKPYGSTGKYHDESCKPATVRDRGWARRRSKRKHADSWPNSPALRSKRFNRSGSYNAARANLLRLQRGAPLGWTPKLAGLVRAALTEEPPASQRGCANAHGPCADPRDRPGHTQRSRLLRSGSRCFTLADLQAIHLTQTVRQRVCEVGAREVIGIPVPFAKYGAGEVVRERQDAQSLIEPVATCSADQFGQPQCDPEPAWRAALPLVNSLDHHGVEDGHPITAMPLRTIYLATDSNACTTAMRMRRPIRTPTRSSPRANPARFG